MSDSVKVLWVRDYIFLGNLLNAGLETSTATVVEIAPDTELPLGFGRMANVGGKAVFKMTQACDVEIALTPEENVPHTLLNGEAVTLVTESIFRFGDTVTTYGTYQAPYYVSRDTVVLLPAATPAQLCA